MRAGRALQMGLGLWLAVPAPAAAVHIPENTKTLYGLQGVVVYVEEVDHVFEKLALPGLSQEELQVDVEYKLRQAGIPVLDKSVIREIPGTPILDVSLRVERHEMFFTYKIDVQLFQGVRLERHMGIQALAPTWSTGSMGGLEFDELMQLRELIGDALEEFINLYHTVNAEAG